MKQSESLDLASSRRSFIFGVGAFAVGIFLPVKKLYFPVADSLDLVSSLVLPRETYLWMVTERIPTKIGPKGYSEEMRLRAHWRRKIGSPPRNPTDGELIEETFAKSLERIADPEIPRIRFESWDCAYYKV